MITLAIADNLEYRFVYKIPGDSLVASVRTSVFVLGGYATENAKTYAELAVKTDGNAYLNHFYVNGTDLINSAQTWAGMKKTAI